MNNPMLGAAAPTGLAVPHGPRRAAAVLGLALSLLMTAAPAEAASRKAWKDASDVGAAALVAAAMGVPLIEGDWPGMGQASLSLIVGGGTAFGLKEVINERRPDGSDNKSMPSAHSAVAFAAAATLENRYGWKAGFPAFAVATLVGVARVKAKKHHWYDVAAGAVLGSASGFLLTDKFDSGVQLVPWADSHGGGVAFNAVF